MPRAILRYMMDGHIDCRFKGLHMPSTYYHFLSLVDISHFFWFEFIIIIRLTCEFACVFGNSTLPSG